MNARPTTRVLGGYYRRKVAGPGLHPRPRAPAAARWRNSSTPSSTRSPTTSNTPSPTPSTPPPAACPRPDAQPALLAHPGRVEAEVGGDPAGRLNLVGGTECPADPPLSPQESAPASPDSGRCVAGGMRLGYVGDPGRATSWGAEAGVGTSGAAGVDQAGKGRAEGSDRRGGGRRRGAIRLQDLEGFPAERAIAPDRPRLDRGGGRAVPDRPGRLRHRLRPGPGGEPGADRHRAALRAYLISHLGKYVPGKAMVVVIRAGSSAPAGARPATAAVRDALRDAGHDGGRRLRRGDRLRGCAGADPIGGPLAASLALGAGFPGAGRAAGVPQALRLDQRRRSRTSARTPCRGSRIDCLGEGLLWASAGLADAGGEPGRGGPGIGARAGGRRRGRCWWPAWPWRRWRGSSRGLPGGLGVREWVLMRTLMPALGQDSRSCSALALAAGLGPGGGARRRGPASAFRRRRTATARAMISVVIPVYNEGESLGPLHGRVRPVFAAEGLAPAEFLFVDDGSQDGSWDVVRAARREPTRGSAASASAGTSARPRR